jgi:hypothetical protein
MRSDDHGIVSERLTQTIASVRFLADFTFASPAYRKGSQPKELADLLIFAGNTLIAFQVKSHLGRPECEHDFDRAMRKVSAAERQFRSLLEALDDENLTVLTNQRGISVPFDLRSCSDIALVTVLHYVGEDRTSPPWRLRSAGLVDETIPITLRAFEANDFFFLAHQFDTIPDFTMFLRVLDLLDEKTDSLRLNFADLTAFARLYPDEILELIDHGTQPTHLREGIAGELIPRADDFDFEESYVVDAIIARLHSGIGGDPLFDESLLGKLRFPPGSVDAYWEAATMLALTSRLQRQHIARLLLRKCAAAAREGHAYGAIISQSGKEAYLVHSSDSSRTDRARELGGLSIAFLGTHDVNSVLAIGAPAGPSLENQEITYLRREWLPDASVESNPRIQSLFAAPTTAPEYWNDRPRAVNR